VLKITISKTDFMIESNFSESKSLKIATVDFFFKFSYSVAISISCLPNIGYYILGIFEYNDLII
jgi:hypothetical protein